MITIVTDRHEIRKLHQQFHKQLDKYLTDQIDCWVGYPSGSFEDNVKYYSELDIWISKAEHHNKFWNGFGVGRPLAGKNNSLNGEINFPYEGNYRKVAGAFAVEENGNILVLHRGKIGGGKPGIGKSYFTDNYRGDFITAIDGDRETNFCLVGELNSLHFPIQISNFIHEIYRVKKLEDNETSSSFSHLTDFNYTEEHFGKSVTERNDPITIDRTHGIIVSALAKELQKRKLNIANDKNRDLFIHKAGQISTLFEIKTSCSTQHLYSAVGQLLIYSIPLKNSVKLVAVLPDKLSKSVSKRFNTLGIDILYYHWDNQKIIFLDIDKII